MNSHPLLWYIKYVKELRRAEKRNVARQVRQLGIGS